jgi:hypothetical protein
MKPIKPKKPKKPKTPPYPTTDVKVATGDHLFTLAQMEEAKVYLANNGYVVITDVLGAEEQLEVRKQLGEDFAGLNTGIASDLQTEPTNLQLPGLFSKGISKDPAAGLHNCSSIWKVRCAAEQPFARLYGVDAGGSALVTSFDSMTYFRHSPKHATDTPWWHVDSNGKECIQGLVLLSDTTEYTGGLVVIPGSHTHHPQTMADLVDSGKSVKGNFLPIDWTRPAMQKLFADCGGARLVTAPKGSISLWDSRLVHSNTPRIREPTVEEKQTMDGGFSRLGFYVCMMPRNPEWEQHRQGLAASGCMTNHWPGMEMRAQHLIFPRSVHALPLTSVALPYDGIVERYGRFL